MFELDIDSPFALNDRVKPDADNDGDEVARLGGALTVRGFDDIGGGKAADTRVEWHDLPALLEACHK